MKKNSQKGFSLVELMIGIVAASVLALTAGALLGSIYKGWARSVAMADMERDAAVALHSLDLAVRGATNVVWSGSTLTAYWPTNTTKVFTASGVSPRASLLCNGLTNVNGRLVTFTNSVISGLVRVTLVLAGIDNQNQDTGIRMGVTNMCIRMRNMP